VVSLDPEKRKEAKRQNVTPDRTGGNIQYARTEEDEVPQALFTVPDPFKPTRFIAAEPDGTTWLTGTKPEGGFGLKRLEADKSLTDVPVSLPGSPDGLFADGRDGVYLVKNYAGGAAQVTRVGDDGSVQGPWEVRLKSGGYLAEITGMARDASGHLIVGGNGFDAGNARVSGLYSFSQ
jgi:hypothetical protein